MKMLWILRIAMDSVGLERQTLHHRKVLALLCIIEPEGDLFAVGIGIYGKKIDPRIHPRFRWDYASALLPDKGPQEMISLPFRLALGHHHSRDVHRQFVIRRLYRP